MSRKMIHRHLARVTLHLFVRVKMSLNTYSCERESICFCFYAFTTIIFKRLHFLISLKRFVTSFLHLQDILCCPLLMLLVV